MTVNLTTILQRPQKAIAPMSVCDFGSNSCEIDVWQTLIHAEMGQHPKQMSKIPFTHASLLRTTIFLLHIFGSYGRSSIHN